MLNYLQEQKEKVGIVGKSDRQVLVTVGDSWTDENFQSSVYKDVDCSLGKMAWNILLKI